MSGGPNAETGSGGLYNEPDFALRREAYFTSVQDQVNAAMNEDGRPNLIRLREICYRVARDGYGHEAVQLAEGIRDILMAQQIYAALGPLGLLLLGFTPDDEPGDPGA